MNHWDDEGAAELLRHCMLKGWERFRTIHMDLMRCYAQHIPAVEGQRMCRGLKKCAGLESSFAYCVYSQTAGLD